MWHIRRTIFAMEKQKCLLVLYLAYYIAVKNIVITDGVAMEMRQCVPLNVALHFVANNKNTRSFSCKLPETNLAFADRFW
jgi:hypothetical protein